MSPNQPVRPPKTRAAAAVESAGLTLAVIVALVLLGLVLEYGAPGLFGGDDTPGAVPPE
jgi:hypothetical protein